MVNLPVRFDFIDGHPCVSFSAGGHSSSVWLTCFIDFRSNQAKPRPDYQVLLFADTLSQLRIVAAGGIDVISAPAEIPALAEGLYIDVDWWTHSPHMRINAFPPALQPRVGPANGISGYVSLEFFPLRTLQIDIAAQTTTVF